MSRRPQAAREGARLPQPSRRLLLGGAVAAPFTATDIGSSDPAIEACEAWLSARAEQDRLGRAWQDIEHRLFRERDWASLSAYQRAESPETLEMNALQDRMDALYDDNQTLLKLLPVIMATTPLGLAGKLAVAALEICPDDHREAHDLIASILRDLRALQRL